MFSEICLRLQLVVSNLVRTLKKFARLLNYKNVVYIVIILVEQ